MLIVGMRYEMITLVRSENNQLYHLTFEKSDRLIVIFSLCGALLVGLGVMLAITANWERIAALVKILLIAGAIAASYALGYQLTNAAEGKPRLGEALIFLGTLFYGIGIWLVSEIFHYHLDSQLGCLIWAFGILPIAVICRSGIIAVLSCTILNFWLLQQPCGIDHFLFWAAASASVSYLVRSPWSLSKMLIGGVAWMFEQANLSGYAIAYLGLAMFAAYLWHSAHPRWERMSKPYLYLGPLLLLAALVQLANHSLRNELFSAAAQDVGAVWLIYGLYATALLAAFKYRTIVLYEWLGCIAVGSALILLQLISSEMPCVILTDVLILAVVSGLLSFAIYRINSSVLVVITLTMLMAQITMCFLDDFFSVDQKSVLLLTGGVVLVGLSYCLERLNRRFSTQGESYDRLRI
jgi:uncharacterized membrane protein